jgi:hypothetical protein
MMVVISRVEVSKVSLEGPVHGLGCTRAWVLIVPDGQRRACTVTHTIELHRHEHQASKQASKQAKSTLH